MSLSPPQLPAVGHDDGRVVPRDERGFTAPWRLSLAQARRRLGPCLVGLALCAGALSCGVDEDSASASADAVMSATNCEQVTRISARPLVLASRFVEDDEGRDPLADHRPVEADCSSEGVVVEGSSFEIDTGLCAYGSFVQPSLAPVRTGDVVRIAFFHQALVAAEPAEAHIAFLLDKTVLWEAAIPIPLGATPYDVEITSPSDFAVGTEVRLHLHNHGANTWKLLSIDVEECEPA
ncbi:MAG: hypothetical protein ACO3JL_13810 [Myxococcota bacterium]